VPELIDPAGFLSAFKVWLLVTVKEGNYSAVGKAVFGQTKKDPIAAFKSRRNRSTAWKLQDICALANALSISVPDLFREVMGIYKTLPSHLENDTVFFDDL